MTTKSKKKSSHPKKSLLEQYIETTTSEINQKAISSLKPVYKDADILSIDDDIKPLLLVISSDICNGNHIAAIEQAAIFKVSALSLKALQAGETPQPALPDLNNILPMIQGTLGMLPSIINCAGSLVECIGQNITQGRDDVLFQYGLAMNIGAKIGNPAKAYTLQEIGVCIGCIDNDRDKQVNYDKFVSLVKTLPRNKYSKRLKELVDLMMRPEGDANTSQVSTTNIKERSSLKEDKKEATDSTTNSVVELPTETIKFATGDDE